jgi:3-hydroxybutyrate dehydrogenase
MTDEHYLQGRRALVTGGGSGIGRATARRLAKAGAELVIVDRADSGREVAEELGGTFVQADLADLAAVDALGLGDEPGIDVLINNAGVQHMAPIHEFPPDKFSEMLRIMVEAPFRILRQVLPHMYAQGWGRVVNLSSIQGLIASPYKSAYVTAKHAVEGLSKVVALEGAEHGVTSNCINPSYARTPLVEGQVAEQAVQHGIPEERVLEEIMLRSAAIKRLVEPEEIAEMIAYLCGPHASFITGSHFTLDCGWTAQ